MNIDGILIVHDPIMPDDIINNGNYEEDGNVNIENINVDNNNENANNAAPGPDAGIEVQANNHVQELYFLPGAYQRWPREDDEGDEEESRTDTNSSSENNTEDDEEDDFVSEDGEDTSTSKERPRLPSP